MPRDSNGLYSLPPGNPVVTGTVITSTWANNTCGDLGNELTDSLSRSGEGGMLAPLRIIDGTALIPGLSWISEISSGFYRAAAQDVRFAMAGADCAQFRTPANGGLWANNQATGAGLERVLTTSDIVAVGNNFPGPNPTLVDAAAAITIGSTNPNTDAHIAIGPSEIQAKANGTTPANVILQPDGGRLSIRTNGLEHVDLSPGVVKLSTGTTAGWPNYVQFTAETGLAANGRVGFEVNADLTLINYTAGQKIQMRVVNGYEPLNLNVEPSMAASNGTGEPIPGIRTPLIRVGSSYLPDQPATLTSTNHYFQVGRDSLTNLRVSPLAMCTNLGGSPGRLKIQDILNGYATLGDTSASGCYFAANGITDAQIVHDSATVLQSAAPGAGGVLVNGLYGLQRVLTLGDLAASTTVGKYLGLLAVNNTTVPTVITTIPVLASKKYKIDALFEVSMATTGVNLVFSMQTSVLGSDSVVGRWSVSPFRPDSVYTATQTSAASSSGMNFTLNSTANPTSNTLWVRFEGTLSMAGNNRNFVPEFKTPVANPNVFTIAQGSYIELSEITP